MKIKNRKQDVKFDVFDDLLKEGIIMGLLGLFILLIISCLMIFLSVAIYAAQVQNTMSLTDYLYSQDHTVLTFFLFLIVGLSVVLVIGVLLASLALFISLRAWKSLTVFCLFVGLFVFLFFVPIHETKTLYAAEISIKPEYLRKHSDEIFFLTARTDFYLSYEEAKEEVEQNSYLDIPRDAFVLKQITKKQEISHPIVHIELPKNPKNSEKVDNGGW
jgi:magnesium-transporting ATPase (P-type)